MNLLPRILIADDDFEDRYIMDQTFTELGRGNAIKLVEDGTQVFDYLERDGIPPSVHLIVLDLNMPRLGGTETLRKLKSDPIYSHITVIIFSTSVNNIEKDMCTSLGAREYITKPTKYQEYLDTCRKFLDIAGEPI